MSVKWQSKTMFTSALLSISLATAACGSSSPGAVGENKQEPAANTPAFELKEPVELTMFYRYGEAVFNRDFKEPIEKKNPMIKLTLVPKIEQEMIATGNVPDIIALDSPVDWAFTVKEHNMQLDLGDLVKLHKFNLGQIDSGYIEQMKPYAGDDKLYALPVGRGAIMMYYNKSIFDKFGIPYPSADKPLTWDETYELAKKLTRTEGGVAYRGIDLDFPIQPFNQLSSATVDSKTGRSNALTNSEMKKHLELLKKFYEIPGAFTDPDPTKQIGNGQTDFVQTQNVALYPRTQIWNPVINAERDAGLKWDIAPYPVWSDKPDLQPTVLANLMTITPTSKHKDAAFLAISYLASEENQKLRGDNAYTVPISSNKTILGTYGVAHPDLKSKQMKAAVSLKSALPPKEIHEYESIGLNELNVAAKNMAKDRKDINTVLREIDENTNKKINEAIAKKK